MTKSPYMKKLHYPTIPVAVALALFIGMASCASIPKESLELSARLDRQLVALQDANATLINQVYAEKEARMTEYLDSVWFPAYLDKLFSLEPTQTLWEAAVNSSNPSDRMEIMAVITKEAIGKYKRRRIMRLRRLRLKETRCLPPTAKSLKRPG